MPSEYKVKTPQHILEINNKKRRVKALVGVWDSPQNCHVVRKPKLNLVCQHEWLQMADSFDNPYCKECGKIL